MSRVVRHAVQGLHVMVSGVVDGWFVCECGFVAVCRHCVPTASAFLSQYWCDAEQRRLKMGKYAEKSEL